MATINIVNAAKGSVLWTVTGATEAAARDRAEKMAAGFRARGFSVSLCIVRAEG